jgi:hypothetical protein
MFEIYLFIFILKIKMIWIIKLPIFNTYYFILNTIYQFLRACFVTSLCLIS